MSPGFAGKETMRTITKLAILFAASATLLSSAQTARAQQDHEVLPAPLPSQIVAGRKVFISNAGVDSRYLYNGGPDRLYNQFYAAMKRWGRYELVPAPAEADLVLEIRLIAPIGGVNVMNGSGSSRTDPQFRLIILDPGTRVTLWVFTEHIEPAVLQGNRDKNFDQAVNNLFNDLRNIAGQPVAASSKK